jgi:hypothetical protein
MGMLMMFVVVTEIYTKTALLQSLCLPTTDREEIEMGGGASLG